MIILKYIYYFFEVIILFFINFKTKNFLIISPRYISIIIKRVFIFDLKNKIFFSQKIRNFFDINTVFQVFGYEEYNLEIINSWKKKIIDFYTQYKIKLLIVDCGANIGSTSIYFSKLFPKAKIISIEPDIQNFSLAKKNSNSKNIKLLKNAIASSNFNFEVKRQIDPRAHKVEFDKKNKKNKTITVMQLLKNHKRLKPFIIKIDIEGFEENLFKKNIEWMDNFKIIIIEIHDWMIPEKSISNNFIKSLSIISKKNKRDLIIQGENLISIRID